MIISPTTSSTAFKLNAVTDPVEMYLQDKFTVHANLSGNPAISIPLGFILMECHLEFKIMANVSDEKMLLRWLQILKIC